MLTSERRVRAACLAGLEEIPFLVCEGPGAVTAHPAAHPHEADLRRGI
ncbi:MAG: hypothetical protein AB1522_13845 [Chloroflexota bacterium]